MATILANNFIAAFNESKNPLIANILIQRALRGAYNDTKEIGPQDSLKSDKQIIGTLYLMPGDENTEMQAPTIQAFVLMIVHEPRLVDYFEFTDIVAARTWMSVYQ